MLYAKYTKTFLWIFGGLLGAFLVAQPVSGQVSFKGKTLRMIATTSPGGGTDLTGRLTALYLTQYLPGNPKIIIQNIPGGAGIKGANYVANRVKPDGLTIMQTHSTVAEPSILRKRVVKYDPLKFPLIGGFNRGGSVIFVRKDAHKRLNDPSAEPVNVGAVSGLRTWNAMVVWAAEYLGWNVRWVTGYSGASELVKALRQGEIDLTATANAFLLKDLRDEGVADLLTQVGIASGGKDIRRSSFTDVPTFTELMGKKRPKGVKWEGYLAWVGTTHVDKWLALPPKTPKKFLQVYRRAFDKVVKNPEFLKLAKKQLSVDIISISGKDLEVIMKDVVDVSDEAVNFASRLRKKYKLPE